MIDSWTPDRMMNGRGISREYRGHFPYPIPMSNEALDKILQISSVEVKAPSVQAIPETDASEPEDSAVSPDEALRDSQ